MILLSDDPAVRFAAQSGIVTVVPENVMRFVATGAVLIGGRFALAIAGAEPGAPPRGVARTTCEGGNGTFCVRCAHMRSIALDEVVVQRNVERVVAGERGVVDERVEVLGIEHFDVDELARGAFDDLVLAEVGPRIERHRHLRVGASGDDQRGLAAQVRVPQRLLDAGFAPAVALASLPVMRLRWQSAPSKLKSCRPVEGDTEIPVRSGPPGLLSLTMLMDAVGGIPLPLAKTWASAAAAIAAGLPAASVGANE